MRKGRTRMGGKQGGRDAGIIRKSEEEARRHQRWA